MPQFDTKSGVGYIHVADIAMFLTDKIVFPMNRPLLPDGTEPEPLASSWESSMRAAGFLAGLEGSVAHHQVGYYADDIKPKLEKLLPQKVIKAVHNLPNVENLEGDDFANAYKQWIVTLENTVGAWHKVQPLNIDIRDPHADMEKIRGDEAGNGIIGAVQDKSGKVKIFEKLYSNIMSEDLVTLEHNTPEYGDVAQAILAISDKAFSQNIFDMTSDDFKLTAQDFKEEKDKLVLSMHTTDYETARARIAPVEEIFKKIHAELCIDIKYRTDTDHEGLCAEIDMRFPDKKLLHNAVIKIV